MLQSLAVSLFAGRVNGGPTPPAFGPLRALAAKRGIIYGVATASYQLTNDAFVRELAREAAILVPEYELKRFLTEPQRGSYDFSAGDMLCNFSQRHAQLFRGHPLVWHAANPTWLEEEVLSSRDDKLLTRYVESAAKHFKGRIHSWDVVNEALNPPDGVTNGLRNSFWYKAFGASYIDMAFHAARISDPDALLVYNDFGCEADGPANDLFRAKTIQLLEGLLARNVPVQAYGMQGHLSAYGLPIDQRKLAAFLAQIQDMGLKLLVTELDVDDSGGPPDVATRDLAVAACARRFLDVVLDCPAVAAVLTWGLSDRYLHAEGFSAALYSRGLRKLPLDPNFDFTPLGIMMANRFAAH